MSGEKGGGKIEVYYSPTPYQHMRVQINAHMVQNTKMAGPTGPSEEEKKAERLAKLEAWKQKQILAAEKQKEFQSASGARSILDEIDRKAAVSPAILSPTLASPLAVASPLTPDDTPPGVASPIPYAGKFDPKAIARKAASSSTGVTKLGTDIALPELAKASGPSNSTHTALKANKSIASAKPTSCKFLN